MDKDKLKAELKRIGTQSDIALMLGLKRQSHISQWITGRRPIPAHHVLNLEKISLGRLSRYELRPDVFGEEP